MNKSIRYIPPVEGRWVVEIDGEQVFACESESVAEVRAGEIWPEDSGAVWSSYYGSHPEYGEGDRLIVFRGNVGVVADGEPSHGHGHEHVSGWVAEFPAGTEFLLSGEWVGRDEFVSRVWEFLG